MGCRWRREMQPGSACHQSCEPALGTTELCPSYSHLMLALPWVQSVLPVDIQLLWWILFAWENGCRDRHRPMHVLVCFWHEKNDGTFECCNHGISLIFIAWLASFLCSMSVPEKYMENEFLWGVGSSGLVQRTVRHKEEKGSCMR